MRACLYLTGHLPGAHRVLLSGCCKVVTMVCFFNPVHLTGKKKKCSHFKNSVRIQQKWKSETRNIMWFCYSLCASLSSDTFPASDKCLWLTGQGLCGSRLLCDTLPLPQSVRGRGLFGSRAAAHGRNPLQIQQFPGKGPQLGRLGFSRARFLAVFRSLVEKAAPPCGRLTNVHSRANGKG